MNVRPEGDRLTSLDEGGLLVADAAATTNQGDESLLTIWQETIGENRPRWVKILAGDRASAAGAVDGFFQELIARDEPVARYWTRPASGSPARVNPGFDARQIPAWFWCPIAACFGLARQTDRVRWPRSVLPSTARALAEHIGAVSRARVAQVREEELQVLTLQRLISSEQDAQRRAKCLEELKQDPLVGPLVANLGPEHFLSGPAIVCPPQDPRRPGFRIFPRVSGPFRGPMPLNPVRGGTRIRGASRPSFVAVCLAAFFRGGDSPVAGPFAGSAKRAHPREWRIGFR